MTKYIVDHSGLCEGTHFTAGIPVELSDSTALALGVHATAVSENRTVPEKSVTKKSVNRPLVDKMVKKADVSK